MVCYNELGCFRDEGPFNYLDLLPAPPEEINTRFFLYTPRNRDVPHPLVYNNASTILTSPYNATLPTKVMIHGFGSSCQRIWAKEMRTALISVVSRPDRSILTSYYIQFWYQIQYNTVILLYFSSGRRQCHLRRLGKRSQFAQLRQSGSERPSGWPASGTFGQRHQRYAGLQERRFSSHRVQPGSSRGWIRWIRTPQR